MKHIFIINPTAGKKDMTAYFTEKLKTYNGKLDYQIYVTKEANDAKRFIADYCNNNHEETTFYSCGGDGTLNECINGAMFYPNAYVTCYPSGSGNDFVKNFGKEEEFDDIDEIINGKVIDIDIIKITGEGINESYCMNICNFGLDAEACKKMIKAKRWPLVSGKMAYNIGVLHAFLFKAKHYIKLSIDDELIYDGKAILCAVGNGICYGGGYYCTPTAKLNDNILDICMVKNMPKLKILGMIECYKAGKHLETENLKKYMFYQKGKKVTVESPNNITYCIDGDVGVSKKFTLEIIPQAIKFVIPKKFEY